MFLPTFVVFRIGIIMGSIFVEVFTPNSCKFLFSFDFFERPFLVYFEVVENFHSFTTLIRV